MTKKHEEQKTNKMKKVNKLFIAIITLAFLTSCGGDDVNKIKDQIKSKKLLMMKRSKELKKKNI